MSRFYPLKVRSLERETEDCMVIDFELPQDLRDKFAYKQGQHLTLAYIHSDGEDIRRSLFTLCESLMKDKLGSGSQENPRRAFFLLLFTRSLKVGDTARRDASFGQIFIQTFFPINKKHYAAFAAGSGITPVISIMKAVLETEPLSRFTLFLCEPTRIQHYF